jgi:DNA replication protein DnaC
MSKPKLYCIICKDYIEVDYIPRENYHNETICSLSCYNGYRAIQKQKYYDEKIKDIPIKYRSIECDKDLLKDNFSQNLFITGKSGVGKTVLAAGIAKECINQCIPFRWISYPAFIMELQNMFRDDKESPFAEAGQVANFSSVLIIDDLGAEKATEWVRQITYFIINEREQRMLPIVLTSNFTLEEIAQQIDVRISSRIAGMCKTIKLSGKDKRLNDVDKKWQKGEPGTPKYIKAIRPY